MKRAVHVECRKPQHECDCPASLRSSKCVIAEYQPRKRDK